MVVKQLVALGTVLGLGLSQLMVQAAEVSASEQNKAQTVNINPEKWESNRKLVEKRLKWSDDTNECAIIVDKMAYELGLYCDGKLKGSYPMDLGPNPVDAKLMEGDGSTPEGEYKVSMKKGKGQSVFYKAFYINYPNAEDRARLAEAKRKGQAPKHANSGGDIEIHGYGGSGSNWTLGCMGVSNEAMDEMFPSVKVGTPVTIVKYGTKATDFYLGLKPRGE